MKENKFLKDISKFFSGAILAQLIGFLLSPFLARLYGPSDFGEFALFTQCLSVLLILSGSSLFLLLPKYKKESIQIITLSLVVYLSFFVSFAIILFGALGVGEEFLLPKHMYFLVLGLFFNNFYALLHFKSVASGEYIENSKAKVIERVGGSSANLTLGYLGFGGAGLILGNIFGQVMFSAYLLGGKFNKLAKSIRILGIDEIKLYLKKFKKHIIFQSGNHFLEFSLVLLFSVLITKLTSIQELGYFVFCYKIINTPLNLIADYFSQAALGRISDFSTDSHRLLFLGKVGALLLVPSAISFFIFKLWGPEIFSFIFGVSWIKAGVIAQSYILAIVSTFFIKALQYIPNVIDKHEIYTVYSFLTFGLPVVVLLYTNKVGISFLSSLEILSYSLGGLAVTYFVTLLVLFNTKSES